MNKGPTAGTAHVQAESKGWGGGEVRQAGRMEDVGLGG